MVISKLTWTKRRKLLVAAVTCTVLIGGLIMLQMSQVAEAAILDPHPGLVGWWRLDEGEGNVAEDSSEFGNHGTIYGATWVEGKHGKALSFDGTDDYINILHANVLTFTFENFSICFWLKPADVTSVMVLQKGNYKTDGWYVFISADSRMQLATCQDGATQFIETPASEFVTDTWYHCVLVRNSSTGKVYVNGTDRTDGTPSVTNPLSNTRPLQFARDIWGASFHLGVIDEVRIYNRALSAAEIQEIFQKGPDFSSRLQVKVPKGTTQLIVTLSWQGDGSIGVTIESPSKIYTEDMMSLYQRTDYSSSSSISSMLNIKRLAVSLTALSSDENWYVILEFEDVEDYRITVEVQR